MTPVVSSAKLTTSRDLDSQWPDEPTASKRTPGSLNLRLRLCKTRLCITLKRTQLDGHPSRKPLASWQAELSPDGVLTTYRVAGHSSAHLESCPVSNSRLGKLARCHHARLLHVSLFQRELRVLRGCLHQGNGSRTAGSESPLFQLEQTCLFCPGHQTARTNASDYPGSNAEQRDAAIFGDVVTSAFLLPEHETH